MSFLERTPVAPSDAELIARVRGGDRRAYGDLFERHRDAATRLARTLTRGSDADDLVAEAFTKVFKVLLRGGGPDLAFRAYLLTAVRRLNVDKARATQRSTPTDDIETLDSGVPFIDPAVAGFESGAAAKAFQSLPERWQLVLWHLEVEGQKPSDIAPLLGMSPNSVSVLAYRAREGLRQAFLQMHAADVLDDRCEWTRNKLGAYVRKATSRRDSEKVEAHLRECRPCTAVYLELTEVNSSLAALLGPLVLGGAAVAYLGGGAATGIGAAIGGVASRAVEFVTANTQAAVVTGTVATVAAAGAVGVAVTRDDPAEPVAANQPARVAPASPAPTSKPPVSKSTSPSPVAVAPPVADPPTTTTSPPAPAPEPEPERRPRKSRTPKPAPPPSPTQEPTPPPTVDAALDLTLKSTWAHLLFPRLHSRFAVTVTGLPDGTAAPVEIALSRPLGGHGQKLPAGCTPTSGKLITCTGVGNQTLAFEVVTKAADQVTITATLGHVAGDDNRDNDSASVVSASG